MHQLTQADKHMIYTIQAYTINRDSRKSRQKWLKNMAQFCENCKEHGKITAIYIAANLLTHGFQLQKNIYYNNNNNNNNN